MLLKDLDLCVAFWYTSYVNKVNIVMRGVSGVNIEKIQHKARVSPWQSFGSTQKKRHGHDKDTGDIQI